MLTTNNPFVEITLSDFPKKYPSLHKSALEESWWIAQSTNLPVSKKVVVFFLGVTPAGFCIPMLEGGVVRTGPIYVCPRYRKTGVAVSFLRDFYEDRAGAAVIHQDNIEAEKIYASLGFEDTGPYKRSGDRKVRLWKKPAKVLQTA